MVRYSLDSAINLEDFSLSNQLSNNNHNFDYSQQRDVPKPIEPPNFQDDRDYSLKDSNNMMVRDLTENCDNTMYKPLSSQPNNFDRVNFGNEDLFNSENIQKDELNQNIPNNIERTETTNYPYNIKTIYGGDVPNNLKEKSKKLKKKSKIVKNIEESYENKILVEQKKKNELKSVYIALIGLGIIVGFGFLFKKIKS